MAETPPNNRRRRDSLVDSNPPTVAESFTVRTRRRSNSIRSENPFESPLSHQENEIAKLIKEINQKNEGEARESALQAQLTSEASSSSSGAGLGLGLHFPAIDSDSGITETPSRATTPRPTTPRPTTRPTTSSSSTSYSILGDIVTQVDNLPAVAPSARRESISYPAKCEPSPVAARPLPSPRPKSGEFSSYSPYSTPFNYSRPITKPAGPRSARIHRRNTAIDLSSLAKDKGLPTEEDILQAEEERLLEERRELDRVRQAIINQEAERLLEARKYKQKYHKTSSSKMSYQNFESSGTGPSNPRQAPPSPSQGISHGNGMNGIGMNPGMVGFPTPAGHQADLNYIMGMVEELSRTLAHNQNLTASIVQKAGEVRELARSHDLSNDEILARAAEALNSGTTNLEQEISKLKEDLASAEHARDENWKLVIHGCNILADIRDKMHKFRADTDRDVLAWHKSYRDQLAHERAENLRLNCLIYDMQAAAARANGHLRDMRRYITDHPELEELRREVAGLRTDRRMWKRMAMPLMTESDSEWSDDDDLRDPKTQRKRAKAEKAKAEAEGDA